MNYDERLDYAAEVLKAIVDHAKDGGSYRCLIYDRLGFGPDAYGVLLADGMIVSNEFVLMDSEIPSPLPMILELIEYVETNLNLKAPNQFRSALLELGYSYEGILKEREAYQEILNRYKEEIEYLKGEQKK
jgi:hypothetical protein